MLRRRLLYLTVLVSCLVFYVAYREWFAWFCLVGVLSLPALSLLLSLPAVLSTRVRLEVPGAVTGGIDTVLTLRVRCPLPVPRVWGRVRVENCLTGEIEITKTDDPLPTQHCGLLLIEPQKLWTCDYLGLFRLRVRRQGSCHLLVEPQSIQPQRLPDLRRRDAVSWQPKPGGGFSENHDLRLYRPGDNLRLIHWKITAKTGKLIYREPITAQEDDFLVRLTLSGTPEILDRKLGRFLYVSRYLLQKQTPHCLHCHTPRGMRSYSITDEAGIRTALREMLSQRAAGQETVTEGGRNARQYQIGGGADET